MIKWIVLGTTILLILSGAIFFLFGDFEKEVPQPDNTDIISVGGNLGISEGVSPTLHTVKITSSGFSPENLEIIKGDTVIFLNEMSSNSWPASDNHPIHTVYPNSDISKCGTNEAEEIFDACKGLELGESYSFTFDEIGTWTYHDHLKPYVGGTIIVN